MRRIFFDTEFTDLIVDSKLISIGLIDERGEQTFYAELSDTYHPRDCGDFTRQAVLPQLEGGAALLTMADLGVRLTNWIKNFGEPVKLVTDSLAWDWPWIQEIFYEQGTWPENLDRKPEILLQEADFNLAIEQVFAMGTLESTCPQEGRLRQHHALDDAKANRLAWLTTDGDVKAQA